jgi:hypothetical protein
VRQPPVVSRSASGSRYLRTVYHSGRGAREMGKLQVVTRDVNGAI